MASFPELRPSSALGDARGPAVLRKTLRLGRAPLLVFAAVLAVVAVATLAGSGVRDGSTSAPASSPETTGLPRATVFRAEPGGTLSTLKSEFARHPSYEIRFRTGIT